MTNIPNPIIDRIRKLLNLAKSSNEHEAASAAAKAAQLMREHEIEEAMLRVADGARTAEEIVEGRVDGTENLGKRVAWKCFIAGGAARAFGVHNYLDGAEIRAMGRKTAVQTWSYTCQYLYREVDRLADEAWDGDAAELARWNGASARAWKNAFRVGCALKIRERLFEQGKRAAESKRSDVARVAALTGPDTANETGRETMALAVIDRDRAEVEAAYKVRSENFGKARSIGQVSSNSGYSAGAKAGKRVNLTGGGRGLPAPKAQIKGGR